MAYTLTKYMDIDGFIKKHYSSRLRFNTMSATVWLDDKELTTSDFRRDAAYNHEIEIDNDKYINEICYALAKENQFSVLGDYLNKVEQLDVDTEEVLSKLNSALHIEDNSIEATYIKKTLVGAVSRVFNPGTKLDTVLVLKGKQGTFKTTFFQVLASSEYFHSMNFTSFNTDEQMICNYNWIVEIGELEATLSKTNLAKLKQFITREKDIYRKPYAKDPVIVPRQFILVGTTNKEYFLIDNTGNRRFWIININQKIDIETIRSIRDEIWSTAVKLYRQNYPVYLTEVEQEISNRNNSSFTEVDMWEELILNYVADKEQVTLQDIFTNVLKKSVEAWRIKSDRERVENILLAAGYNKPDGLSTINNKTARYWSLK